MVKAMKQNKKKSINITGLTMNDIQIEDVVRDHQGLERTEAVSLLRTFKSCTWCSENKIKIHPCQYGCRKHITNEENVIRLAKIEHAKYCKEMAKKNS